MPGNRNGPSLPARAASENCNGELTLADFEAKRRALRQLLATVDLHELVHRRAVQHTLLEATWAYWMRRSQSFAAVGTPDCDAIAEACRNHARLVSGEFGEIEPWDGFPRTWLLRSGRWLDASA